MQENPILLYMTVKTHPHGLITAISISNNMGLDMRNLSSGVTNNKGADQPAHPRSLISTFVIRLYLDLLSCYKKNFHVADETGLGRFVRDPEDRCSCVATLIDLNLILAKFLYPS